MADTDATIKELEEEAGDMGEEFSTLEGVAESLDDAQRRNNNKSRGLKENTWWGYLTTG